MSQRPEVGVIADSPLQRHVLQGVLTAYGLSVNVICEPGMFEHQPEERIKKVDCWLVDIDDEKQEAPVLECLFELGDAPILFGLGKAPAKHEESYISWERRLFAKLEEHLGRLEVLDSEESIMALSTEEAPRAQDSLTRRMAARSAKPAREVWILAASLGGPAAVKEFLDNLPANLDIGFLYAQHVDPHFSKVLTQVLSRHSELELHPLENGNQISAGEVLMVPVDRAVSFGSMGAMVSEVPWKGPYGPSIDQLLANALDHFGNRCHAIVFSGMGNDGAMSAPRMKRAGCEIWTQSPDSCANSSMPQSICDLDCSSFSGTPTELAAALVERCKQNGTLVDQDETDAPHNLTQPKGV